uniref:Ig-like domain-containing protein n=1 Tax=Junco hyemalis TaxID=40217 RepID=A0A8C5IVD1_JUNHY
QSCGMSWPAGSVGLQEAGGGQRAPGDSVTLSCRGSGFTFEDYYIFWFRQAPGGSPEWVSYISGPWGSTKEYGAAVMGRAEISRDNSRSEAYLSLRPLQAQDSARYFCAIPRRQEMQMSFNTNRARQRLP